MWMFCDFGACEEHSSAQSQGATEFKITTLPHIDMLSTNMQLDSAFAQSVYGGFFVYH
jgi:hypothetical protein